MCVFGHYLALAGRDRRTKYVEVSAWPRREIESIMVLRLSLYAEQTHMPDHAFVGERDRVCLTL